MEEVAVRPLAVVPVVGRTVTAAGGFVVVGAALLWLLRSKSGAFWSAPLVYPLAQWPGAAAGADCAWLPVRHGGFWKNFLFYVPFTALFAPGNLDFAFALGVSVLPLEYVVFGTRVLLGSTVDTCSTRGFW